MTAGERIAALSLSPVAAQAASILLIECPTVIFTSGRRGVADQARAMAQNVTRNRQWIHQTYVDTPEARQLQALVNNSPAATPANLQVSFTIAMNRWTDAQRAHISKHFSGDAFDVQPVSGPAGDAIKSAIRKLPGLVKFLEEEGGLIRWHAQFA